MREILLSSIDYINAKTIGILKKNGIETVEDLLLNFPCKFDDYTLSHFDEIVPDTNVTIAGFAQGKASVRAIKSKLSVMTFNIDFEGNKVRVSIFNRHFLKSKIEYGTYVRLTGKFNAEKTSFTTSEIHFDELSNDIAPVFNIKGITDSKILELKEKVLSDYIDEIEETLPSEIIDKYNLLNYRNTLQYINTPEDIEEVKRAVYRIKFEELFLYQLKIKYMLYMRKHFPQGITVNFNRSMIQKFIDSLPYKLTIDQNKALDDILGDMGCEYKMNRLLQGEVGSGKTVVAAICLYAAYTAGFQGAIMVPTEVLAVQHYKTFKDLFKNEPLNIVMLSSSVNPKERSQILSDLEEKKIDIIIGTHSLFQKDVVFNNLGLVVTDEEHRFGVKQRVSIVGKGHLIDHLKMSATPIPRTLAISILGETDFTTIKTLPGNKKEAITKYVKYEDRKIIFDHIKEELDRGHQIYIVAPMIEESEVMDLKNATEIYERMKKYYEGVATIGLVHSKLKPNEKEQVMEEFSSGKINILVSTTVIEVGVNVVNATTIIILDADRFGIAQLHQMRGRVRRSDEQAYCFLVSNTTVQSAIDRLKLVEKNSDGFVLAEEDLIIRGPGDFFGEKQSGMINFKMADILNDKEIFNIANEEANIVIENEKLFKDINYKSIYELVDKNYQEKKEMLD